MEYLGSFIRNYNANKRDLKEILGVLDAQQLEKTADYVKESFPDIEKKLWDDRIERLKKIIVHFDGQIKDLEDAKKIALEDLCAEKTKLKNLSMAVSLLGLALIVYVVAQIMISLYLM